MTEQPTQKSQVQQAAEQWTSWLSTASSSVSDAIRGASQAGSSDGRKTKVQRAGAAIDTDKTEEQPATTSFVQDVVAAGFSAAMREMGKATDMRFQQVETGVEELRAQVSASKQAFAQVGAKTSQHDHEIANLKGALNEWKAADQARIAESERLRVESLQVLQDMKDMREAAKNQTLLAPPGLAAASSRSSAPSGSNASQSIPHELRTEAIMSGLGRGLTTETLKERALHALELAEVPKEWHYGIASNTRDTAIFIDFKDAASLRLAANKIRRASIQQPGATSRVWLDARRTKAENRPNRAVHRACEGLADVNSSLMREGKPVTFPSEQLHKNMRRLTVEAGQGGQCLCFWNTRLQELQWTNEAKTAFEAVGKSSDLEQISAWSALE
jgi:hypothetical protein